MGGKTNRAGVHLRVRYAITETNKNTTAMLLKESKIFVAVATDETERRRIIARLLVEAGFARIQSDAAKIITPDIFAANLPSAYFVAAATHNFLTAEQSNRRLFEMAARGLFVAVGARSIPRQYQFICRPVYPENIL